MKKAYAMVIEEYGKDLVYHEFDLPEANGSEIIVKIMCSGICGSDVHVWKGEDKRSRLPQILGHEGLGIIESINKNRTDIFGNILKVGDMIVWDRGVMCKSCYECTIKRTPYNCKQRWSYGFSKSIYDYPNLNGSYASHMRLTAETQVIRILPKEEIKEDEDYIPYVSACCAGTTTACAFEQADIKSGDTVLIQGPGPLGIYAVLFAKECGASKIIVIGGTEERLELCKKAGADYTINRKNTTFEERIKLVLDYTDNRGADAIFELAGTTKAIEEGVLHTAIGGKYISAGVAVDVGDIKLNWFKDIVRKNVTVKGIWVGDIKNTWQAVKIYERHKDTLKSMITHRIPLKDATKALKLMEKHEGIKIALIP